MSDLVAPDCDVPSCQGATVVRFLRMTPLCAKHAVRAYRRAAVNVLIVGPLLAGVGYALQTTVQESFLIGLGWFGVVAGCLVALSAPWYFVQSRRFAD